MFRHRQMSAHNYPASRVLSVSHDLGPMHCITGLGRMVSADTPQFRRRVQAPRKNASWHFVRFLVTELHSQQRRRGAKTRPTGGSFHRATQQPGRLISRSMTGGVLWTWLLHPRVRYTADSFPGPLFLQGPTWGPLLQMAMDIKRLRAGSSHIVNLKADVELRVRVGG